MLSNHGRPLGGAAGLLALGIAAAPALGQEFIWANGAGGNWTTGGNWNPVGIPDSLGESALINLGGTFTISLTGSPAPDSVQLLSTGATLEIANAAALSIGSVSGFLNDASVIINPTGGGNFTRMRYVAVAPLSGSGTLRLNALNGNLDTAYIETAGGGQVLHQTPHTIAGAGRIPAAMNNASLIVADLPGKLLEITGTFTQSVAGELRADPGIISLGNGALVTGGTLNAANGGTWQVTGSSSINGLTSNANGEVRNNSTLRLLSGGLTNHGVLHVNSGAGTNFTRIRAEETCTLGGTGAVNLRASGNLDTAYLEGASDLVVLTQSASHSITGTGRIYAVTINQGTVRATSPGSLLEIRSSFTQTGAGSIIGDNADAALGTNAIVTGGFLKTIGAGRVLVTGNASIGGVANQGAMSVDNNAILRLLAGGVVNTGTVVVNTTSGVNFTRLRVEESCAVTGPGAIILNASVNLDTAYIESAAGVILTHGLGHTIRGTGRIYSTTSNSGTILADVPGKLLEIRGAVTQSGSGRIEGNPGIAAIGSGAVISGGVFASGNGGAVRSTGTARVNGTTNTGLFQIANNTSVVLLAGGLTNNGSVEINDDVGTNFTSMVVEEACVLNGTGMLTLRAAVNPDTAYIDAGTLGLTHGALHTITGDGRLFGNITNLGTIRGSANPADIVRIRGAITQQGSGTIIGGVGAVALDVGSVTGGTLQSAGGPVRVLAGTSYATSVENMGQLQLENNARLSVDSLTNNGIITINAGISNNFTALGFAGVQTLGGNGEILLRAASNLDSAYIESTGGGASLTIGSGQTLRGTGRVYGVVSTKALISPGLTDGAIGRIEPRGTTSMNPESRLTIDAVGDAPGQFDILAAAAPLTLDGELTIEITGWTPTDTCTSFDFITAPSISGEFDSFTLNAPPPPLGRVWRLDYQPTKVSLRLVCPADLTGDCLVDDGDFQRFVFAYNILDCADPVMPQGCPSDLNQDGVVDDSDFVIWLVAYNALLCE
ncbi:MAG: hypothetical protein KF805_13450 [Phycisphaeraceae bacterium]|nr:hypothetical protein [Phycisphaeraceae bacterium]